MVIEGQIVGSWRPKRPMAFMRLIFWRVNPAERVAMLGACGKQAPREALRNPQ